eukprot:TRINITY_DN113336_c0_g1_i1.p1 TRINITY_DN113336_c0_g1~~TRINITY_DN113336_c0_g1_i1.p1  ORF type:complete len:378 (+),score=106.10 TRINITY_DN113336_c0_g1_i1:108-1241(+)
MASATDMASADAAGGVQKSRPSMSMAQREQQVKLFSFFEEMADPVKRLGVTAWRSKGKLANDIKAYVLVFTGMVCSMPGRAVRVVKNPKLHALLAEEEDPQALGAVVCGTGGALCLGSVGAVIGVAVGSATGLAFAAVPALFTFGLSLPVGAIVGGTTGLVAAVGVSSTAGFVGGATSGCCVAYFRSEIRHGTLYVGSKMYDVYDILVLRPVSVVKATTRTVRNGVRTSADYTQAKAQATAEVLKDAAADPRMQVTAAGAGVGAAALGTAGAAGGAMAGGAVGMAVGLVPALFTFGLSIPVGAIIGGGTGLVAGGAAGTTVGFTGGAAAGFVGYTCKGYPSALLNQVRNVASSIRGDPLPCTVEIQELPVAPQKKTQ